MGELLNILDHWPQIKELLRKFYNKPVYLLVLACIAAACVLGLYSDKIEPMMTIINRVPVWLLVICSIPWLLLALRCVSWLRGKMQEANKRRMLKAHDEAISARLKTLSDAAYLKLLQLYQMQTQGMRLMLPDNEVFILLLFKKGFIKRKSDREIIVGGGEFCHDYLIDEDISEYLSINPEL